MDTYVSSWSVFVIAATESIILCWYLIFQGGIYVLQLMDTYVSSWSVFVIAATESIIFGWVYGR